MNTLPATCDTLIIGGGVIGMSLAYELSRRGVASVVVDRQPPGLEASWAGAGILPPGSWYDDHPALINLAAASAPLNAAWSAELLETTGIDNQFRITGGVHVATCDADVQRLRHKFDAWSEQGIDAVRLADAELRQLEPRLAASGQAAYHVPGEGQINNRLHVEALRRAAEAAGAVVAYPAEVMSLDLSSSLTVEVGTLSGSISADRVVLTAGAWSGGLAELFRVRLAVKPIRGQMLEFGPLPTPLLERNVHCADKYVVPRSNGRLIVGSTVDDVGFDKHTVPEQLAELEAFARRMIPELEHVPVADAWAGLRPASADGLPYIGPVPSMPGAYVATGHFRSGLQFASATAVALADSILGSAASIDLEPFRIDR